MVIWDGNLIISDICVTLNSFLCVNKDGALMFGIILNWEHIISLKCLSCCYVKWSLSKNETLLLYSGTSHWNMFNNKPEEGKKNFMFYHFFNDVLLFHKKFYFFADFVNFWIGACLWGKNSWSIFISIAALLFSHASVAGGFSSELIGMRCES